MRKDGSVWEIIGAGALAVVAVLACWAVLLVMVLSGAWALDQITNFLLTDSVEIEVPSIFCAENPND